MASETEDVERVKVKLWELGTAYHNEVGPEGDNFLDWAAPRVLAAIRAAAHQACCDCDEGYETIDRAIDAALAALTDHPGGTAK